MVRTKRDGGCHDCFGFINECEGEGESYEGGGDAARMVRTGRLFVQRGEWNGDRFSIQPDRRDAHAPHSAGEAR